MNFKKSVSYIMAVFIILTLTAASYGEISSTNKEMLERLRNKLKNGSLRPDEAEPSYAIKKKRPSFVKHNKSRISEKNVKKEPIVEVVVKPSDAACVKTSEMVKPVSGVQAVKTPVKCETPVFVKAAAEKNLIIGPADVIETGECFDVVLDPGHGGRYEPVRAYSGDHWDPFSKTFLLPYNFGASANGMYEHEWTLQTAKKVEELLQLTHTEAGFKEFCRVLGKYADISGAKIKRVQVNTHLTRRYSWEDDPEKNMPNVNKKYRLFDSPDSFAAYGSRRSKSSEKMYPGRISFINQLSPDLVVCLHNNSSPNRNVRGFSSVIVPHFDFFSNINGIITNGKVNIAPEKMKLDTLKYQKVASFIALVILKPEKIDIKTIISDTATYFTGFRAFTHKFIGLRYLMVTWRYNTSSLFSSFTLFFMRENSVYENYRRAGGPEGYGGDNFYSSEELIRYIRSALWNDFISLPGVQALKSNASEYAGPHSSPFVSDWAIPLHVNAITAFVELGYLSNAKDRKMLKEKQTLISEAIAAGVYSLLVGLKPLKIDGVETPRGQAIDFSKYGRDKNSNGYFNISCRPIAF